MSYILFIFIHFSYFCIFLHITQVSHSFRSTLLTPSWQCAIPQGMEEEENQDDGFRSPMKRCTSQPWADQTDVNWCQLYQLCTSNYHSNHIQISSTQNTERDWGNPIIDKLQNVSKCYKSIQICTFGRKSQGGRVLLSCICQIFSAFLSDFWGGIPRTMWHVATAKSTATWNHQFSQQLVSDKTLSTQRGQSYGGPL